jgi:ferric-dicitrate binding protein FerR (iron transport regulator)
MADRAHELIQKYLDGLASEAELAELEELLASDAEVAGAFADAARLHAGLEAYFRKQYKIDQVAALLDAPESVLAPATGQPEGRIFDPARPGEAPLPMPAGSAYFPIISQLEKARRSRNAARFQSAAQHWRWIAAVVLLLAMGVSIWSLRNPDVKRAQLISGQLAVAGRGVRELPLNRPFTIVGPDAAVIELPDGARMELAAATRATLRKDGAGFALQLESGRGVFQVAAGKADLVVETELGVVTATDGKFSLELVTKPVDFTPTEPVSLPRLTVVVALGSVTVERDGKSTTLSADQEQVFL